MSEQVVGDTEKTKDESGSNQKEDFVPRSVFVEVSNDMHKHKARARDFEAKYNAEVEAKKAKAKKDMEEKEEYKELYVSEKKTREELEQRLESEHEQFINSHKVNALLQELGGLNKQEYIKHANLKAIEINDDGSINTDSLKKEADRFRQEHSVLLKSFKAAKLPGEAPKTLTDNAPKPTGFDAHKNTLMNVLKGGA